MMNLIPVLKAYKENPLKLIFDNLDEVLDSDGWIYSFREKSLEDKNFMLEYMAMSNEDFFVPRWWKGSREKFHKEILETTNYLFSTRPNQPSVNVAKSMAEGLLNMWEDQYS